MGAASQHTPESEQYGVASFVWRSQRPFHPLRLWERVLERDALPPVLRSKGFFWVANRPEVAWEWCGYRCKLPYFFPAEPPMKICC